MGGAAGETTAKEARRREILDAAFAEFAAKGYGGASMAAIAQRARASKETLYAWFGDKERLFTTLLESRLGGMKTRTALVATEEPSASHVLPVLAEDILRFMLEMAPLSEAMAAGAAGDRALELAGQAIRQERGRFVDYLLRCRERGEIAFDDDPFELASLFVAMAEGEWSLRLSTGMTPALTDEIIAEHARRVTRIFLKGLAP